ncbi:hypothetical protein FQR65_LT08814 [Abscondita terminalis]|nr:hypothetical protein FQR65_LT08814 [Abscondita terminalis]
MWRSSDSAENSYLEDTEPDSSHRTTPNLNDSNILDLSLYETTTSDSPLYDAANSSPSDKLSTNELCSMESGYLSSEYLRVNEENNDSFCDHVSNIEISNQPVLLMDFNVLINEGLSIQVIQSRSDVNTHKFQQLKCNNIRMRNKSSHSEFIKMALQRSANEPNLTGDFSKTCYLPTVVGKHQDLRSIAASTMSLLIKGEFSKDISFKIIDCRYPYEYEGGHIESAINLYTKDMIINSLLNKSTLKETKSDNKRYILIFHCEFSSNRAPTLYRFLRNFDRNYNEHLYPTLFYPEMYLLEGGYKNFYHHYSNLCLPKDYVPMNHPKYNKDLSYFRDKTKTSSEQQKRNNKRLHFA